jgi:hypothetical protein
MSAIDSPATDICIVPTFDDLDDPAKLAKILASHDWAALKREKLNVNQMLTRMRCSRCGLGRLLMLYDVKESSEKRTDIASKVLAN